MCVCWFGTPPQHITSPISIPFSFSFQSASDSERAASQFSGSAVYAPYRPRRISRYFYCRASYLLKPYSRFIPKSDLLYIIYRTSYNRARCTQRHTNTKSRRRVSRGAVHRTSCHQTTYIYIFDTSSSSSSSSHLCVCRVPSVIFPPVCVLAPCVSVSVCSPRRVHRAYSLREYSTVAVPVLLLLLLLLLLQPVIIEPGALPLSVCVEYMYMFECVYTVYGLRARVSVSVGKTCIGGNTFAYSANAVK